MAGRPESSESVTAHVALRVHAGTIEADVAVPTGPTQPARLLPFARALSREVTQLTVLQAEKEGRAVTCHAGCGACCRQLVPISETEARLITELVEHLPEPRRSVIRARFAEARRRLDEAGMLDPLLDDRRNFWEKEPRQRFGIDYFRLGIPCPFLEAESCSIYDERPIICREYLVTSDPKHCADPASEQVEGVTMPTSIGSALGRLSDTPSGEWSPPWVPLVLAPEWAEAHPDEAAARPGPELFREFLETVAGMVADRCGPLEDSSAGAPASTVT